MTLRALCSVNRERRAMRARERINPLRAAFVPDRSNFRRSSGAGETESQRLRATVVHNNEAGLRDVVTILR
jgi:hypothetical protein